MDEMAAVQESLRNLREDIAASEARTRDQINRHADEDAGRFAAVTKAIEVINKNLDTWTGSLNLLKWMGAICLPIIAGAVVTHLIRHWN